MNRILKCILVVTVICLQTIHPSYAQTSDAGGLEEATDQTPAPTQALLKKSTAFLYSLSPDGGSLAIAEWTPSGNYLLIRSTTDRAVRTDIPFGKYRPTEIRWLGPTRLI